MAIVGTVREWHDDAGWGVVDSPATPGGCWTHFSHIQTTGYRALRAGQLVTLEWSSPGQDGFPYRTVRVWLDGETGRPTRPDVDSRAFSSTLSISYDGAEAQDG